MIQTGSVAFFLLLTSYKKDPTTSFMRKTLTHTQTYGQAGSMEIF